MRTINKSFILICMLLMTSCSTTYTSTAPSVTATDELLQSLSIDAACSSLTVKLPDQLTYIDDSNYTGNKYLIYRVTEQLLVSGIPITQDKTKAKTIVVLDSKVQSIDSSTYLLGIPEIALGPTFKLPGLSIFKQVNSVGISQVSLIAYNATDGLMMGNYNSKYGISHYYLTTFIFMNAHEYPRIPKSKRAESNFDR
jgi:hypothetical protein